MARPGYGSRYRRLRAAVLASSPLCGCPGCRACGLVRCHRQATTVDHVPPLATAPDPESWEGVLVPCCLPCNLSRGGEFGAAVRHGKLAPAPTRRW